MSLLLFALAIVTWWCYSKFRATYSFWRKRGVIQYSSIQIVKAAIKRYFQPEYDLANDEYGEYPGEKFTGVYQAGKPVLLLTDPDLIETVLVQEFSHMHSRINQSNPNGFYTKNLTNVGGAQWKSLRTKLNPAFSSSKLKGLHDQLIKCGEVLLECLSSYDDGSPLNMKHLMQTYSINVTGSCLLGLNLNFIRSMAAQFRRIGVDVFGVNTTKKIVSFFGLRPWIRSWGLDRILFARERADKQFLGEVLDEMLIQRERDNVMRPDFLHLMNEQVKKNVGVPSKIGMDSSEFIFDRTALVSNAFLFFSASSESTANTVVYALYELALNPNLQTKAYEQVNEILSQHDGIPDYLAVEKMVYLDWLMSETLRKYPTLFTLTRSVNEETQLPGTDFILPVGMQVSIPIYSIHRDPRHFPDPEVFKPERFDPEKSSPPRKGTYLPFGGGPRKCIGYRLAKLKFKVVVSMLLNKYKIVKCKETKESLRFSPNSETLWPVNDIWLALQRRTSKKEI